MKSDLILILLAINIGLFLSMVNSDFSKFLEEMSDKIKGFIFHLK